MQRAFDTMQVALSVIPRMSPNALVKNWTAKVTQNTKSDKVCEAYVDAVYTVFNRLLNNIETKNLLLGKDSEDDNNLNSICKLDAVVKRASSPAGIHCCVSYCLDNGHKLSPNALTGRACQVAKGSSTLQCANTSSHLL